MATWLIYRHGIEAHITDVFLNGKTCYYFVEKKMTYSSERIACKRALVYCKKKANLPGRRRRRRRRNTLTEITIVPQKIIIPTISIFIEGGVKKYKVIETGRVFLKEKRAILNALKYYKSHERK